MKLFFVMTMLAVFSFPAAVNAQCSRGQCVLPSKAVTVDKVLEAKPVRKAVRGVVVAPIRIADKILEAKPVRKAVKGAVVAPVKVVDKVLEVKPIRKGVKAVACGVKHLFCRRCR